MIHADCIAYDKLLSRKFVVFYLENLSKKINKQIIYVSVLVVLKECAVYNRICHNIYMSRNCV